MAFLNLVLEPPTYGYEKDGELYVPSHRELWKEFFSRLNVFADRKNWLSLIGWTFSMLLLVPLLVFLFKYFSWPLAIVGFVYSMVWLGTHGTIYFHRYSTHRAFEFSNPFAQFIVANLAIKIIPEETYVISHYVHHMIPEKPGDPYNAHAGFLYCFLADAIHQPIARNLSETNYKRLTQLLDHTNVRINSYAQYQKWGSLCNPVRTLTHFVLNWAFWYGVFYFIGGNALATAIFGMSFIWAMGIRTFNYAGHGGGKDKRNDAIDFNRKDLSINQCWPGLITGEWHNNHHLYPNGARAGFLRYQLDTAWYFIRVYSWMGGISSYRDFKEEFFQKHYLPYVRNRRLAEEPSAALNLRQAK
jgi:sn-1 stearoyl-lipid 9-desaturase